MIMLLSNQEFFQFFLHQKLRFSHFLINCLFRQTSHIGRICPMSFLAQSSKHSINIDDLAFKKISQLITRFHSVLLPKAHDSGIFRDLSEEQEYLLTNLDSESDNSIHSILAGCLAIDSCLSNIFQSQRNLTENILKSLTLFLSSFAFARPKEPQQTFDVLIDGLIYLTHQVHQLPFCANSTEYEKHIKILPQLKSDENLMKSIELFGEKSQNEKDKDEEKEEKEEKFLTITKKIGHQLDSSEDLRCSPTFKVDAYRNSENQSLHLKERALLISEMFEEKKYLQEELKEYQKKIEELQNQNQKIKRKMKGQLQQFSAEDQLTRHCNILQLTNSKNGGYETKVKSRDFLSVFGAQKTSHIQPSSNVSQDLQKQGSKKINTEMMESINLLEKIIKQLREEKSVDQKEIKTLRDEVNFFKRTNEVIKKQYEQEKREYKGIIKKLEDKIWMVSGYGGFDVYELLNELEEEIEELKYERREDRRIMAQVQSKLMGVGARRRIQYNSRDYYDESEEMDSRTTRSRLRNKARASEIFIGRSRSRSNNSRIIQISRNGNNKMRETMGSLVGNYSPRYDPSIRKSSYRHNFDDQSEYEERRSHYSGISNNSPSPYSKKGKTQRESNIGYEGKKNFPRNNYKEQIPTNRYKDYNLNYEIPPSYELKQEERVETGKFLRNSKTEQNLHHYKVPVVESIPFQKQESLNREKKQEEKMIYNDSFMADISENAQVITSMNRKGADFPQEKKTKEKNDFANYCHQKITKIVGFKDPTKKQGDNNVNSYSVTSSLLFDNPFQNTDDVQRNEKNDGEDHTKGENQVRKWGKDKVLIPEVQPLVLKNVGRINENFLKNSGSRNERIFIKPDRNH